MEETNLESQPLSSYLNCQNVVACHDQLVSPNGNFAKPAYKTRHAYKSSRSKKLVLGRQDCEEQAPKQVKIRSKKQDRAKKSPARCSATAPAEDARLCSRLSLYDHINLPGCPSCEVCGKPLLVVRNISYDELKQATNNFSWRNFLSEGESGFVYMGLLSDGKAVAVKTIQHKLDAKFHNEIQILSKVKHPNVVNMVGYCEPAERALLVYDFVSNGTLDWHLSDRNAIVMPWSARRIIAVQVATGLQFLHGCKFGRVIHGDIQARNILLTKDYTPVCLKITGFGQARWERLIGDHENREKAISESGSRRNSCVEDESTGTHGCDVYSFGVLLLELISGRTVSRDRSSGVRNQQSLVDWARPLLPMDFDIVVDQILDPRLELQYNHYELFCMVNAASQCIRKDPTTRPSMRQILSNLEDNREKMMRIPKMDESSVMAGTHYSDKGQNDSLATSSNMAIDKLQNRDRDDSTTKWQMTRPNHKPSSTKSQRRRCRPPLLSYNDLH